MLASPESPFENIVIDESSPDAAQFRRLRKGHRPSSSMLTIHEDIAASVTQNLQPRSEVIGSEVNANAEVTVQAQVNTTAASDDIPPESNDADTVLAYNRGEPVHVRWPRLPTPEPVCPRDEIAETQRTQNLKPIPRLPHIRGSASIERLRFNVPAFKAENTFFDSSKNPYKKPRIPSDRFWTGHMRNYYITTLYDQDRIFPHEHLSLAAMEGLPCFNEAIECLRSVGLLPFCLDEEHWNEELLLQFYATLHISGYSRDPHTWILHWMTCGTKYSAPVQELLDLTPLPAPGDDYNPESPAFQEAIKSVFHLPEPNMSEMLSMMKPLPPDAPYPTHFFVDDMEYLPRTIYHILRHTLWPVKGHDSSYHVAGALKTVIFNVVHGIKFNMRDLFIRYLASSGMELFEPKVYAPWIMRLIKRCSNTSFKPSFKNHGIHLPEVHVLREVIYPESVKAKAPVFEDNARHQSFTEDIAAVHIPNPMPQQALQGQYRQARDTTTEATTSHVPHRRPARQHTMTDRELLVSLHQKQDKHHEWSKRQMQSLLHDINRIRNVCTKTSYIAHEACRRSWKSLLLQQTEAELSADGYHARYPFDSTPPPNAATWRATPSIESSDYSSSALSAPPHIPADEDVTSPANPTMRQDTASGPAAPPNSSVDPAATTSTPPGNV